ncbi:glutathione S-transferase 1-like isoform X1 [Phthorimaea operculella]|nr:glutathione S-transferase 1-like isoform X1 [Phthorimaea operculella]
MDVSPPARACMMACDIFNVPVEMIDINITAQMHKTPEFLQLNPLHTVPVFQDEDLVIQDSHAILMYLSDVYAADECWYPRDARRRALVNQKLFFDTSYTSPIVKTVITEAVKDGVRKLSDKRKSEIEEIYGFLEEFLIRDKYLAGDNITIADLSVIPSFTTLCYIMPFESKKYPKTYAWVKTMAEQSYYKKYNEPGLKVVGEWIQSMIKL